MPVLPDVGSRMIESAREQAARLEVLDQVLRDAILDRAGRVHHLELGEDPDGRVRRHPRDLDERRVADRVEDVVVAAAVRRERLVGVGVRRGPASSASPSSPAPAAGRRPASGAPLGQPPGHRRQEPDLVALADRRREPVEVADVLAVDVDVDEPVELAVVGQELALERRVLRSSSAVDDLADRRAGQLDLLVAADLRPQDRSGS